MKIEKITMPKLGESVTEGTINSWLVKAGDFVQKYEPIAEVMSDKVNAEIPSSFTGKITELVVSEGDTVAVDTLICYIEVEGKEGPATNNESEPKQTVTSNKDTETMKTRYSPAVLRLAAEHDIDLTQLTGTGAGGRITRKDVLHYAENKPAIDQNEQRYKESPSVYKQETIELPPLPEALGTDREIPVTGVRKATAKHMSLSMQEIPHAWMMVEVDVTDLVKYRNKIKDAFKKREGYSLTYFAFFIHAVAQALREHPEMNSMWAGDKIIQRHEINISIAVAKDNELFVPVIKNADEKSIAGIARDIYTLAHKARQGLLTPQDVEGGTFTVNNTGTFGSISSMGIINHPQAAILQVESIVKKPVIIDEMFAARDMVNLSLSLDHRVLDGLICGKFMARVKQILENINEDTVI